MAATLLAHTGARYLGRQDLPLIPTPDSTPTHRVVPHAELVRALIESLGLRNIAVVRDQYAVSVDGARLFGALEVDVEYAGVRLALGLRNSHDKSFALGIVVGYRAFVCDNLAFSGDFEAVSKKHSKGLDVVEVLDTAVSRMQRAFEPMKRRIDAFRGFELPDLRAKELIYRAFVEDELDAPKHLARIVHREYFNPEHPEFVPRTLWSLENAFTHAMKALDPVPQMRATADLGRFLGAIP